MIIQKKKIITNTKDDEREGFFLHWTNYHLFFLQFLEGEEGVDDKLIWRGNGRGKNPRNFPIKFYFFLLCFATTHTTDNGFFRTQLTKMATGPQETMIKK